MCFVHTGYTMQTKHISIHWLHTWYHELCAIVSAESLNHTMNPWNMVVRGTYELEEAFHRWLPEHSATVNVRCNSGKALIRSSPLQRFACKGNAQVEVIFNHVLVILCMRRNPMPQAISLRPSIRDGANWSEQAVLLLSNKTKAIKVYQKCYLEGW